MKISVDELLALPQQRLTIAFRENIDNLDAVKPVVGDLTLTYNSAYLRVVGHLQTLLKLSCHRCLRPYFQALSVDVDERFAERLEQKVMRDRELTAIDFVESLPADGILDVTDVVYQSITLATPTYCLCGPECPGMSSLTSPPVDNSLIVNKKSSNLGNFDEKSIDPRWKNLKTLFANDEND